MKESAALPEYLSAFRARGIAMPFHWERRVLRLLQSTGPNLTAALANGGLREYRA
jgi:hypothetical protein